MTILFFLRHQGYIRNFESTLKLLAERGHSIEIALGAWAEGVAGEPTGECLERLESTYPRISSTRAPEAGASRWERYAERLRATLDWLRYLEPAFSDAGKLRTRAERHASLVARRAMRLRLLRRPGILRALTTTLRAFERAAPVRGADRDFIAARAPDLVLVTPLVDGGIQHGYLRAAHRLGIPAGLCLSSWDNLTSKGLIYGEPDFVTVWNEALKREAVELHGCDPASVFVTGAQAYDHWFEWTPSTTRDEFCRPIGIDPEQPFLLYMCSSGFIAGDSEVEYVERWIAELRLRPGLEQVGILVRPHPANAEIWRDVALPFGNAAVWKLDHTEPATLEAKREFFDSIYHSAGVVGLNTSALVESAIVGRPVFTLLSPEFAQTQGGTLHFEMIGGADGMLDIASSTDEHAAHLAAALADPSYGEERRRRFLEAFVRPHGLGESATARLVGVLDEQAARRTDPRSEPLGLRLLRLLLTPATFLPWRSERELAAARKRRRKRKERARKKRRAAEARG